MRNTTKMTVKELIKILSSFNEDSKVIISVGEKLDDTHMEFAESYVTEIYTGIGEANNFVFIEGRDFIGYAPDTKY